MRSEISSPLHFGRSYHAPWLDTCPGCVLGTWVVISPTPPCSQMMPFTRWRFLDPRTCRGYNLAQRPKLSSGAHESFAQCLGLASTGRDCPPSRPPRAYGRSECLRPPHRSSLHTVISLYDRQLKRSVMALVIEDIVPDDPALGTPRYLRAVLYGFPVFHEYDFVPSTQKPMDVNTHGLWTCCPLA